MQQLPLHLLPALSLKAVLHRMKLDNVSFAFYMNASCGLPGHKPCHSVGPHTDTSPVYAPDASLAGVARYKDRFHSHTQFYKDAAAGELPAFTWLNCAAEAADHPCSDMAKGERCQKVRSIRFVACTVVNLTSTRLRIYTRLCVRANVGTRRCL